MATGRNVLFVDPVQVEARAVAQIVSSQAAPRPAPVASAPRHRRVHRVAPEPSGPAARPAGGPTVSGTVTGQVATSVVEVAPLGGRPLAWASGSVAALAAVGLVLLGGIPLTIATARSAWPVLAALAVVLLLHRALVLLARRSGAAAHHHFQLTAVSGATTDCVLTGLLHGGRIERGDVVDVFGRRPRVGPVRVVEVVVPARAERVRGRITPSVAVLRSAVAVPAVVAVVLAVAVLVIVFTR